MKLRSLEELDELSSECSMMPLRQRRAMRTVSTSSRRPVVGCVCYVSCRVEVRMESASPSLFLGLRAVISSSCIALTLVSHLATWATTFTSPVLNQPTMNQPTIDLRSLVVSETSAELRTSSAHACTGHRAQIGVDSGSSEPVLNGSRPGGVPMRQRRALRMVSTSS